MTLLIEAEHLFRYYGKHCAVHDVSFTLARGQVLGFLGPNGAGKTSTLQMLAGLLAPSAGSVRINGLDMATQAKAAKRQLGFLPDVPPLYKDLTVCEFLAFCGQLHGLAKSARRVAIARSLARCGLLDVATRLISQLSKGYQQRLGIAQAILHNPEVVILDEPTVGLDPLQIVEIRGLIRELGQEHGVILSTHILSEVQETCTHVQIIHQGRLKLHDSLAALAQQGGAGVLQVTTRHKPDPALLGALPGVLRVELVSDQQVRLHFHSDHNPTTAVTQAIMEAGWGLQALNPLYPSMEDLFLNLTQPAP